VLSTALWQQNGTQAQTRSGGDWSKLRSAIRVILHLADALDLFGRISGRETASVVSDADPSQPLHRGEAVSLG